MEVASKVRLRPTFQTTTLWCFVLLVFSVFCVYESFAGDLPEDYLPQIQILEIVSSPTNRTSTVNLWKERNSDVIIGEDTSAASSRILMKCNATYPVQWVYLGDGRPEFTTFTNVKWQEDPNVPLSFEAEASLGLLGFQGVLREEDTGNYTCRSIQEPAINSYYYIFVPGDGLFAAPNGTNVTYAPKDHYVRVPCGVSHPKASVTLCKRDKNDKLNCPVSGASGFNIKGGFLLNLKKQQRPSGTYVCTANFKGTTRIVEHHIMREDEKPKEPSPAPAPPPPTFITKPGKNLCDPSPCGKQAECSVVNGRAVCYCFRGLNGNPYDECAPGKCRSSKECPRGKFCRQGQCTSDPCNPSPCGKGGECTVFRGQSKCSCGRGFTGLPPSCVRSCSRNEECSLDEACIKSICQSPCPGPCGMNSECRVLANGAQRTAQCSCPVGFLGDPLKSCYKFNSTTPGPWNNCPPGYVGVPPACQRKDCESDLDCPFGRKCMKGVCDKGMSANCPGKCGVGAECIISPTTTDPICACPAGTTGNPMVQCHGSSQVPPTSDQSPHPSWGDPCSPNPCVAPAECHLVQGSRTCVCPPGFTGDPSSCVPFSIPSSAFPPSSGTRGSHVYCRFDGDCKPGDNCVGGRCYDSCNGLCGYNAICDPGYERKYRSIFSSGKLVRSRQPENTCMCPPGHEGNPYVSCMPIQASRSPSPALPPASTSADPVCFPNPCGRFADCFSVNNAPVCKCQPGFEGNAYQDCREQSRFSPSPSDAYSPPPRPTQGRATPASPSDLDYQGHSWGHHRDDIESRAPQPPIAIPPNYDVGVDGSRFNSKPPPSPTMPQQHSSPPYPILPSPSRVYGHSEDPMPIDSTYPSHYPTSILVEETPSPKTLDPPMPPLDTTPLIPPHDLRDECTFKNPYADYDMESCGVGHRCERDFRGVKRCVCISPFDCTGPTSIYARNKCQSSRDCLLSDHICMNGTCGNPCSPEYSPCAGIAYSECRVIEGNVLCTCRRGYVGNPASGLDCRPKRLPSSGSVLENERNKYLLIHGGYHNASNDYVINVSHERNHHYNGSNTFNVTDYEGDNGSIIINDDDGLDDDDLIINSGTLNPGLAASTRHHRRHNSNSNPNNNQIAQDDKEKDGQCGFGSGRNCDEKSHCRVVNDTPMCVCRLGYKGKFPNCKPECEKHEDCPEEMACQYKQCLDPCIEEKLYCAKNAFCRVVEHAARCECEESYVGIPWIQCSKAENATKNDCMGFNCQKRKGSI